MFALFFVIFCVFSGVLYKYAHFRLVASKYWARRNVYHLKPVFLLGNLWRSGITENVVSRVAELQQQYKKKKLLGLWFYTAPALLITDLELARRVLIKDFDSFRDRGVEINEEVDPLAGHLLFLKGSKWRNLRVKLTPTFTSGKMKFMFPTMVKCGKQLQEYLRKTFGAEIEVKDLLARFTTDIISSCAFGIDTNSLENPNSEFREFGRKIFKPNLKHTLVHVIMALLPALGRFLRLRLIPEDVTEFFINAVSETINHRGKYRVARSDFLQLLIELMRAKVEGPDGQQESEFGLNQAAAQCFVFFAAGFETSSTVMTFALYELALNPDIQTKLQDEIDEVLNKNGVQPTYEAMSEMEYLDMVVNETLRKYPPAGTLQRVCTEDYLIPELKVTVEKGTKIFISVKGFHQDPEVYPNPEVFDPHRFSAEGKQRRNSMSFIPFGEGLRSCIGSRFGLMQVKVGLIAVLQDFRVEISRGTPIPLRFDHRSFIPAPLGGVPLVFHCRKTKKQNLSMGCSNM